MSGAAALRLIALITAIVGAWILWQSTGWGLAAFDQIVRPVGTLSGDQAHALAYQGPAASLRVIGGILMGVGLLRALEPPRNG